jgi:hypothetical protein
MEWTMHDQPSSTYRRDVIYGNGVYVAGPRDYTPSKVAVSKDGIAWTYHNVLCLLHSRHIIVLWYPYASTSPPPQVIPDDLLHRSSIHGVSFVNGATALLFSTLFITLHWCDSGSCCWLS